MNSKKIIRYQWLILLIQLVIVTLLAFQKPDNWSLWLSFFTLFGLFWVAQHQLLKLQKKTPDSIETNTKKEIVRQTNAAEEEKDYKKYRRELLGNIAHEMKTPLFTIQGYILTLLDGAFKDPIICKKYLENTNVGINRLESIIKDLDLINQIQELKLNPTTFDIKALTQKIFDLLEVNALKKKINMLLNVDTTFPQYVFADKERIEQVLINLISNAITYGNIGGMVTVSIKNNDAQHLKIEVSDDGKGIPEKDINRIFERFYRVDKSRNRQDGSGTGLGLSIVKHILDRHRQDITVSSEKNKGTAFSFLLPQCKIILF